MLFTFLQLFMFKLLCFSVNAKLTLFETELYNILDVQDRLNEIQISDILNYLESQDLSTQKEVITVKLYYETLCPGCIAFDTKQFRPAILKLGPYLKIKTYPYGNAKTKIDAQGKVTIRCQHGEAECYGNMLHACALDIISNNTEALLYNICMMEPHGNSAGSDDKAADRCAKTIPVNSKAIKACAKSERGFKLLQDYGEKTQKINHTYVPWVLVNEKLYEKDNNPDFFTYLCDQFKNPPSECT